MKTEKVDVVKIPEFLLTYIYYGNPNGVDEADIKAFDKWYNDLTFHIFANTSVDIIPIEDENGNIESYFSWTNPITKVGCNVVDCDIVLIYH